jgi:hypothetical protein
MGGNKKNKLHIVVYKGAVLLVAVSKIRLFSLCLLSDIRSGGSEEVSFIADCV